MGFLTASAIEFQVDPSKPLKDEAARAAELICKHGISYHGDKVGTGEGNPIVARNAAQAFSRAQIQTLKSSVDPEAQKLGEIISLRQEFQRGSSWKPLERIVAVIKSMGQPGEVYAAQIGHHALRVA